MNWTVYLSILGVMVVAVVVLVVYRKSVADAEDDSLHVQESESGILAQQQTIAKKLESIDRWGKLITLLAILYAVALAGLYVYRMWTDTGASLK